ncbi:exodeoxyribonuclease III [Gilvimarinus sp. SDUM040013]|uniref:Exodeoxyribonuclease III n=1 Tax=Gilvimarinus gilvus TaxID=3058038 RepID=A0ABU4RTB8_9GAMM|nr:exodeoxyribonuclease III [Gilvimarinus sp. SDUM040013]MDO3386976.1 exodeoxyribonuclease III [Gilvimarinus sp. SDUM040013]MDX6848130.1 exodeoxyribonuclease III [Gilvimarinus sp. SDUM040013]
MKAISFNINSIRSRLHQLQAIIDSHQPDFIGLQETKVADEQFPLAEVEAMGYHIAFHGQKAHYGVALMSRHPFATTTKGFVDDTEDSQRRFVGGSFDVPKLGLVHVYNGYFPQGESREHPLKFPAKQKYYADLQQLLETRHSPEDSILLMGDMNVSHQDIDIGIGEDNRKRWLRTGKCSFLPEEREWLDRLVSWGLIDTYRQHFPTSEELYSWFDYRSRGFERDPKRGLRIDLILASAALAKRCADAGIDYDIRAMEKPSDHCPIWATFTE